MSIKIDEQSTLPIGWVLSGLAFTIAITITGVFWVSTVNFRLERIEEKLGIPRYQAASSELPLIPPVFAGTRGK